MGDAAATRAELLRLLAPAVRGTGLDLEDVVVWRAGSRHLVRVVLDRDGGLDLDTVAEASRLVSSALDADDVLPGSYVLEVTSPGIDRPLTAPRHWRRALGRLVRVVTDRGTVLTGRVVAGDDQRAAGADQRAAGTDHSAAGTDPRADPRPTVRVEFRRVRRAVVQVEF